MRILTAIDASRESVHALRMSCQLVPRDVPPVVLPVINAQNPIDRAAIDESIAAVTREMGVAPTVLPETRPVNRKLLAQLAQDYDLCVLGTHDGLRLRDFVFGDRLVRLAWRLATPTLVVRGKSDVRRILTWNGCPSHPLRKDCPRRGFGERAPGEGSARTRGGRGHGREGGRRG